MPETLRGDAIPDDVRNRPVTSDDALSTEEKGVRMNGANDEDHLTISTEVPTFIKWLQSIEPTSFDWIRVNSEGAIIGAKATIPKGIVKLQSSARKSDTHSQMVSYGNERGHADSESQRDTETASQSRGDD